MQRLHFLTSLLHIGDEDVSDWDFRRMVEYIKSQSEVTLCLQRFTQHHSTASTTTGTTHAASSRAQPNSRAPETPPAAAVSATSEAFPAARYALNLSAYPLDPTVRQWFEINGLPLDASGSVEMQSNIFVATYGISWSGHFVLFFTVIINIDQLWAKRALLRF